MLFDRANWDVNDCLTNEPPYRRIKMLLHNLTEQKLIVVQILSVLQVVTSPASWMVESEILHIHLEKLQSESLSGQSDDDRTNRYPLRTKGRSYSRGLAETVSVF